MTELNLETCPNCRGIGTVAGCSYTWCSRCDKTGKIAVKRPISKVEEFKSEWTSKYGFPPTDSDIFNAGMLRERNAAPASPVASVLTDERIFSIWAEWNSPMGLCRDVLGYSRALLAASMGGDRT